MHVVEGERPLIVTHQNADADAIGSSYFLSQRYGGKVLLPNGPDRVGKNLLDFLNLDTFEPGSVDIDDFDQIIVVDTPTPQQLLPLEFEGREITIIDHHDTNSWDREVFYKNRTSCAEIVFEMEGVKELSRKEGIALGAGVITDTSGLRRARSGTLSTLSDIMEMSGVSMANIYDVISQGRNYSEKVSRLKGAQRLSYREVNGFLLAWTEVGSFESSVASSLLLLGADVGITGSQRDKELLISLRCVDCLNEKGLDLGSIVKEMTDDLDRLNGGGHPGAAVLKGRGEVDRTIYELLDRVGDWIEENDVEREKV